MLRLCRLTEYNILPSILLMRISPLLSLHFITFSFCLGEDLTFLSPKYGLFYLKNAMNAIPPGETR